MPVQLRADTRTHADIQYDSKTPWWDDDRRHLDLDLSFIHIHRCVLSIKYICLSFGVWLASGVSGVWNEMKIVGSRGPVDRCTGGERDLDTGGVEVCGVNA